MGTFIPAIIFAVSLACGSSDSTDATNTSSISSSSETIAAKSLIYSQADNDFEGYIAHPSTADQNAPLPGVLIVHDWNGLDDYEKMRAEMTAELGYVALALDLYGLGVRPTNQEESAAESGKYRENPGLWRERLNLGLKTLRENPLVDSNKILAIGYCFGGSSVIELARDGADLAGVVSFHGGLASQGAQDGAAIRTKILVLHGAADPYVPSENLAAFELEMEANAVDYRRVDYEGAVHCFTQAEVGTDASTGCAYDAKADVASWEDMRNFFESVLTALS